MLIVPLHRRLTRETFPFATAALIIINVFVFLFLQDNGMSSGAMQRRVDAGRFYQSSGLIDIELPAYRATLQRRGGSDDDLDGLDDAPGPARALMVSSLIDNDYRFLAEFDNPVNFDDAESHARWRDTRNQYEARRGSSFTRDWVLRYGEWSPARMFGAAFLHGGFAHLIGNMIFLALLGLLVELALGPWRFLLLYVIGAFGASAGCLFWRGEEVGAMLGASGAIAALMGAFAVIWAGREVRVFYWFFVVFNYVKVQALWLLPLWLGWELYNLLFTADAGISFETHAGGIVSGALCAFAFSRLGWIREDRMDDEADAPVVDRHDRLQQALADLGALRLESAEAALRALLDEEPDDPALLLALLRCARLGGQKAKALPLAETLLAPSAADAATLDRQLETLRELQHLKLDVEAATRCRLAQHLLAAQRLADAESTLDGLAGHDDARLPSLWLALGRNWLEQQRYSKARAQLSHVVERAPRSAEANKARFLLAEMPPDRSTT
ncbi:MAG: rhomboid family intramembrane serine protease [Xanthomonadales bacterium]|nr:rhomboid family intramembrane serine protease [Xanthomonadales bacterium]